MLTSRILGGFLLCGVAWFIGLYPNQVRAAPPSEARQSVQLFDNLGAALLIAGQPGEAEAVYRPDLAKNPSNGWTLFGLTQSLRAQQKNSEAETVEQQFKAAWTYADVTLAASRF